MREDAALARVQDEDAHCQAMLFKAQCLWRDYEEMVSGPHSPTNANRLLDKIEILEAHLKELGMYRTT